MGLLFRLHAVNRASFYGLSLVLIGLLFLFREVLYRVVITDTAQLSAYAQVEPAFERGEFVIAAIEKEGQEGETAEKIAEAVPGAKVERIAEDMGAAGDKTIYLVTKSQSSVSDKELLTQIESLTAEQGAQITSVERNGRLSVALEPNDPYWVNNALWGLKKIDMAKAWDSATGSTDIVVADIDTGVNYNHEDLKANMWQNPGETAGDGIDNDGNGYADDIYGINAITGAAKPGDPMDDYGHGTHVAGTVGAAGNNNIGVVGVNWQTKIIACKFLNAQGYGTEADAIKCFDYLKRLKEKGVNVRVTNNSYGDVPQNINPNILEPLKDAIDALGNLGILNVFAAGNNGQDLDKNPFYPASFATSTNFSTPPSTSIIAVAASTSVDNWINWSNYGSKTVHLAAPGVTILSTGGGALYNYLSGTSMATPHVAGAAALLLAKKPDLAISQLKSLILDNVDSLPPWSSKVITGGRLNVFKAMQALNNLSPPPPKANLRVSSIAVSPLLSQPSSPLAATVTVENNGSADAGPFVVDFYENRNSAPGANPGDQRVNFNALAAGVATTLTFSLTSPSQVGSFKAWAQIDTASQIDESDETDNVASASYQTSRPDLTVDSLTITPNPSTLGGELTAGLTIKNIGGYASPAFDVNFFKDRPNAPKDSDVGDKTWNVAGLAAGATTTTLEYKFAPSTAGDFKGWAYVDTGNKVAELLENNNASSGVGYSVKKPADLVVESFTLSSTDIELGKSSTATVKIKNQGDIAAGQFKVDFYQNSATAPDANQAGDKTWTVASLAAGAKTTLTDDFTPAAVGDYRAWARADRVGEVSEGDENNNTAGPQNYSVKASDLIIDSLTVEPASSNLGTKLTATAAVKNTGSLNTGKFDLDFYQDLAAAPDANTPSTQRWNIGSIAAGAAVSKTFDFTPVAKGDFKAWAQVDFDNKVKEVNETNNTAGPIGYTISLNEASKPDLIVSINFSPNSVEVGETVRAAIKVENKGKGDAGAFEIDFYHHSDGQPSSSTPGSRSWEITSLAPDKSQTQTHEFTPQVVRTFKTWAWVDRENNLAEESESNNLAGPESLEVRDRPPAPPAKPKKPSLAGKKVTLPENTTYRPAAAAAADQLFFAWTGTDARHSLNTISSNDRGYTWPNKLTYFDTSDLGPTMASINSEPIMLWIGQNNKKLNVAKLDVNSGKPVSKTTLNETSDYAFVANECSGKLGLTWIGEGNLRWNFLSSPDGVNFPQSTKYTAPDDWSPHTPAVACLNGVVYIFWTGGDPDGHLNVASSTDGRNFGSKRILFDTSPMSPIAVSTGKVIKLGWVGTDKDKHLNVLTFDGKNFYGKVTFDESSQQPPWLVNDGDTTLMFWPGTDSNHSLNVRGFPN